MFYYLFSNSKTGFTYLNHLFIYFSQKLKFLIWQVDHHVLIDKFYPIMLKLSPLIDRLFYFNLIDFAKI